MCGRVWVCPPPPISPPGQSNKGKVGKRKDGSGGPRGVAASREYQRVAPSKVGEKATTNEVITAVVQFSPSLTRFLRGFVLLRTYSSLQAL